MAVENGIQLSRERLVFFVKVSCALSHRLAAEKACSSPQENFSFGEGIA
jgi:hypothetical protein